MAYEIKLLSLCDIELDGSFLVLGRGDWADAVRRGLQGLVTKL